MVGGEEQRRVAGVLRHRLERVPESPDKLVAAAGGVEVAVVAPQVRPLVGLAEHDVKHPRPVLADVLDRQALRNQIEGVVRPDPRQVGEQPVDDLLLLAQRLVARRVPPGQHRDAAALDVDDRVEHVPRPERGDLAFEAPPAAEPFEDGDVGVGDLVVGVDAGVGESAEHLVVAGIAELEAVGEPGGRIL